jgi:hypothetical protein
MKLYLNTELVSPSALKYHYWIINLRLESLKRDHWVFELEPEFQLSMLSLRMDIKKQKNTVPELLVYWSRINRTVLCTDHGVLYLQLEKVGVGTPQFLRRISFTFFWKQFTHSESGYSYSRNCYSAWLGIGSLRVLFCLKSKCSSMFPLVSHSCALRHWAYVSEFLPAVTKLPRLDTKIKLGNINKMLLEIVTCNTSLNRITTVTAPKKHTLPPNYFTTTYIQDSVE